MSLQEKGLHEHNTTFESFFQLDTGTLPDKKLVLHLIWANVHIAQPWKIIYVYEK